MKVYVLTKYDCDSIERTIVNVFKRKEKAIDEAIRLANEMCVNMEDLRRVDELPDDVFAVFEREDPKYYYDDEEPEEWIARSYGIIEMEVIN